ncbi:nucleoside diphosphate kinase homolog 5 [Sabethes cyaneus]|uniref:nucleoside diphosphate kinase homolog 5 n=1 Tax=Sabethes cyaneus TaxID=53552 RepID=UPI00237E4336|nr:nucleoside diphosphate kinase homolog 5 [Sabethes cyaneus]
MEQYERTLALITPDGMQHRDTITQRIREAGFFILQSRVLRLTPEQASEFYRSRSSNPDYRAMIIALTKGPVQAMCLSKRNAVQDLLWLIGPERYPEAVTNAPGSLRALFADCCDDLQSAVLGSRDAASAEFEVKFFFPSLILEPIGNEQQVNRYLTAMVNPTLMDGLHLLAKERPEQPALWLSKWLLLNNPYKPKISATNANPATNETVKLCNCKEFSDNGLCSCLLSFISESNPNLFRA